MDTMLNTAGRTTDPDLQNQEHSNQAESSTTTHFLQQHKGWTYEPTRERNAFHDLNSFFKANERTPRHE